MTFRSYGARTTFLGISKNIALPTERIERDQHLAPTELVDSLSLSRDIVPRAERYRVE
jgi:hypothetical protein